MLEYELTPKNAGIILWGDAVDMHETYEHVHRIVEKSPFIQDKESYTGLAYDLRKAYEGSRKKEIRKSYGDTCPIYGVEILWPDLVVHVGVLRAAMAYADFSKADQSLMYSLEGVVEAAAGAALVSVKKVDDLMYQMQRIGMYNPEQVWDIFNSRLRYFVSRPPEQRINFLRPVLRSFDPLYSFHADRWVDSAVNELVIPIEDFETGNSSLPEFEW